GVLPGECLDQTSADGRFPTGTTVQKEQFVYVPHIDTAAAGVFKGSALRQQKDQVPFSLFEWADPQKQKQEAPKVLRSICTRPASSAARSTAPSTARSSLKAAGSEVLNPSLAGVAVQGQQGRLTTDPDGGAEHGLRSAEPGLRRESLRV
ncbi:unnamed protein product, partial [Symbiodinium sp. KB8]